MMNLDRLDVGARAVQALRAGSVPTPTPAPAPAPAVPAAAAAQGSSLGSNSGDAASQEFLNAAHELRQAIGAVRQTDLRFNVDEKTQKVQFEVVDRTTGDVVRQVPQETLVRFAEAFDAYLGMLFDKGA